MRTTAGASSGAPAASSSSLSASIAPCGQEGPPHVAVSDDPTGGRLAPLLALRLAASHMFDVPMAQVHCMGWLGGTTTGGPPAVPDWRDHSDPRVVVLRQILQQAAALGLAYTQAV